MRKPEDNSGGLGVRTVVPIKKICTPCISGFKAYVGAAKAKECSTIERTSAG